MSERGRSCPLSYRYRPEELAGPSCCAVTTLYVVGCLYGNTAALHAVLDRAAREDPAPVLVFNGDFHYLDTTPAAFRTVAQTVAGHTATLGNIEAELADPHDEAGCGCGYPDYIDDATVARSNQVLTALRDTARHFPELLASLATLPRFLTVDVGGHRIGVIHGDPENLAGWRLALEAVEPTDPQVRAHTGWHGDPTTEAIIANWFDRAQVQVLACTHTGLPYAQDYTLHSRRHLVINNGAAGLPSFRDRGPGVLTRLSTQPGIPPDSLYGLDLDGLRCDALPVSYDHDTWIAQFLTAWPPGSAGHTSYYQRLTTGTDLHLTQAARGAVQTRPALPRTPAPCWDSLRITAGKGPPDEPRDHRQRVRQAQRETEQAGQVIQALAQKLQAAAGAGDPNARDYLLDLKSVALQVDHAGPTPAPLPATTAAALPLAETRCDDRHGPIHRDEPHAH